jgi:hypothetical protein
MSGANAARFTVTTFPPVEKARSEGTEVATQPSHFFASLLIVVQESAFARHQINGG